MPVIAEAMAMTTMTPMATPRMVSAARTLLARSESSAMPDAFDDAAERSGTRCLPAIRPGAPRWDPAGWRGWRGRPPRPPRRRCRARRPPGSTRAPRRRAAATAPAPRTRAGCRSRCRGRRPTVESVADSTTNWARMSRRLAPSALRMPISRVRSATAISMMFMITMPPTTSEMATRPGSAMNRTLEIFFHPSSAPSDGLRGRNCSPGPA